MHNYIVTLKRLHGRLINEITYLYCTCTGTYRRNRYSCLTCFENIVMSSSNDSDEHTSPVTPLSLGVQVANSHFSKTSASRGNRGCLKHKKKWKKHAAVYVCRENNHFV